MNREKITIEGLYAFLRDLYMYTFNVNDDDDFYCPDYDNKHWSVRMDIGFLLRNPICITLVEEYGPYVDSEIIQQMYYVYENNCLQVNSDGTFVFDEDKYKNAFFYKNNRVSNKIKSLLDFRFTSFFMEACLEAIGYFIDSIDSIRTFLQENRRLLSYTNISEETAKSIIMDSFVDSMNKRISEIECCNSESESLNLLVWLKNLSNSNIDSQITSLTINKLNKKYLFVVVYKEIATQFGIKSIQSRHILYSHQNESSDGQFYDVSEDLEILAEKFCNDKLTLRKFNIIIDNS